jgi:Cytochrome P450
MMLVSISLLLPFAVILAITLLWQRRRPPKGYRLVPGPKGVPILGNTLQVPPIRAEKKFMEWAREYGELFRIQMGWNEWVFVNSDVATKVSSHLKSDDPRVAFEWSLMEGNFR